MRWPVTDCRLIEGDAIPDLTSVGRALFLAGIFLMVTGDWPQPTLLTTRWTVPLPWLGWPWLYLVLLAASLVFLIASGVLRIRRRTTADFLYPAVASLVATFLLSVVFSKVPPLSWWAFGCFLAIVAFMLAVARIVEDRTSLAGISIVLAVAALFLALRVIAWRFDQGLTERAYHIGNNAWLGKNQIAWVLNLVAPLLLAGFLATRAIWATLLYGAAWLLAAAAIFLVFSPTGVVALALTTLTLCALNPRYWRRWLPLLAGSMGPALVLLAVTTSLSTTLVTGLIRPDRYPTMVIRQGIWRQAVQMIVDHPVVGIGLGTYDDVAYTRYDLEAGLFTDIQGGGYAEYRLKGWHAHNTHLHILAETGMVGFLAWCYFWIAILWFLLRRWRDGDTPGRLDSSAVLCVLLALLVHSMTDVLVAARVHASLRMDLTLAFLLIYGIRRASPGPGNADAAQKAVRPLRRPPGLD